jgi:hypothetical protein
MNIRPTGSRLHRTSLFALLICAGLVWGCGPARDGKTAGSPTSMLPDGPPSGTFEASPIGDRATAGERPRIAHVQIADLDGDGLPDVLVCDALRDGVSWIRQSPHGSFAETVVASIHAPAHVTPIDFDGDGDLDLLVSALGVLMPSNSRTGSVIVLENDGHQRFTSHVVADRIARVADAEPGDLDGDGDLDIAIAGFGYDDGETSWLENKGGWRFELHTLLRLSGTINTVIADINNDGRPDIVALVSQEWEEIWAFVNEGRGGFTPRMIWGSTNPDFGSSWLSLADMDHDGDVDFLYSNGDAFDYAPANSRPWHGVQWLENKGQLQFDFHRIADLSGASSPQAADLDGDGDLDVVVASANNDWDNPAAPSLVWLENNGRMQFTKHAIASSPTHLITLAAGDLDGNGTPDIVAAGMHINRPFSRMGRVTAWINHGPAAPR